MNTCGNVCWGDCVLRNPCIAESAVGIVPNIIVRWLITKVTGLWTGGRNQQILHALDANSNHLNITAEYIEEQRDAIRGVKDKKKENRRSDKTLSIWETSISIKWWRFTRRCYIRFLHVKHLEHCCYQWLSRGANGSCSSDSTSPRRASTYGRHSPVVIPEPCKCPGMCLSTYSYPTLQSESPETRRFRDRTFRSIWDLHHDIPT